VPRSFLAEGLPIRGVVNQNATNPNSRSFDFSRVLPGSYDLVWIRSGPFLLKPERQLFPVDVSGDSDLELRINFGADVPSDRFQVTRVDASSIKQPRSISKPKPFTGSI